MKILMTAFCIAAIGAVPLVAQATKTETTTKVVVKKGKDVHVTGCVEPSTIGNGFMLTHVADKKGTLNTYMLVSEDSDLAKHVGHRLQVEGKASDLGHAHVETETKVKTTSEHGDDKEIHSKTQERGDLAGVSYLGVKSFKMIAASCP